MEKYCVMLSGSMIANDYHLITELQKNVLVLANSDNSRIESIIQKNRIDLILFEITEKNNCDVEFIRRVKYQFPTVPIILLTGDGDNDLIIAAFSYGVMDAFKKPYKYALIAERVNAIFRKL